MEDYTLEDLKDFPLVEIATCPMVTYTTFDGKGFAERGTYPIMTYQWGVKEFIEKHPMCKIFIYPQDGELYKTIVSPYVYSPETFEAIQKVFKQIRARAIPLTEFMYEYEMNKNKKTKSNNRRLLLINSL
jgi:hypothetical protein